MNKTNENNDETLGQELRRIMRENFQNFLKWLAPNPAEPWYIDILRYLYKVPAVILIVLMSPITIVILLFTFLAAF